MKTNENRSGFANWGLPRRSHSHLNSLAAPRFRFADILCTRERALSFSSVPAVRARLEAISGSLSRQSYSASQSRHD